MDDTVQPQQASGTSLWSITIILLEMIFGLEPQLDQVWSLTAFSAYAPDKTKQIPMCMKK
jgi:hypothetical protein